MRYSSTLGCGFLLSVCGAVASGVLTFAIAASIDQDHGMSCHVAGQPDCDNIGEDIDWVIDMTIGGAAVGFSIPFFLTLCLIGAECKDRIRNEGMSCSEYITTGITSKLFGFFSSIKNNFRTNSYTNLNNDSLKDGIENIKNINERSKIVC